MRELNYQKCGKLFTQNMDIKNILFNENDLQQWSVDCWEFKPCGFSLNAINSEAQYITLHLTPEPDFSYVSLETNESFAGLAYRFNKAVQLFAPKSVVLFVNSTDASYQRNFFLHLQSTLKSYFLEKESYENEWHGRGKTITTQIRCTIDCKT